MQGIGRCVTSRSGAPPSATRARKPTPSRQRLLMSVDHPLMRTTLRRVVEHPCFVACNGECDDLAPLQASPADAEAWASDSPPSVREVFKDLEANRDPILGVGLGSSHMARAQEGQPEESPTPDRCVINTSMRTRCSPTKLDDRRPTCPQHQLAAKSGGKHCPSYAGESRA